MEWDLKTLNPQKRTAMKISKELTKNLARTADFINTVSGGTVYPTFKTFKEKDHYKIEVAMPSVDPNDLKEEVNNDMLMIFQQMELNLVNVPNVLGMFKLANDAVLDEISAEYEDDLLTVIIPKDQMSGGFRRDIKIQRPY